MRDQSSDADTPERLLAIADWAPVLIWSCDSQGKCDWFNLQWLQFTGDSLVAAINADRYRAIHEEDRGHVRAAFEGAFEMRDSIELEYRMHAADESWHWVLDRSVPRYDAEKKFCGYVGVCFDITRQVEQRARLQEREAVMRRLQQLGEREHAFLSAGIHDGLLQDIIGCDMLMQGAAQLDPEILEKRLERARQSLRSAIKHGRRLISELRPMIMDEQGLLSGIEFYAAEVENRSGIRMSMVRSRADEVIRPVWDLEVFRIVQEAINNAETHSKTEWMSISVATEAEMLKIRIEDGGDGFELEKHADSFGLLCMKERAELFGGTVEIRTSPGNGCTVAIEMPLPNS